MNQVHKAPLHLWVIGVVTLIWNGFGCYIYTMAMTRNPAIMADAPPEMVAALDAAPAWSSGAWAFGVWGALAGSLLLLLRSRWAVTAFAISLIGLIGSTIYEFMWDVPVDRVQQATIWVIALFLLWYAWRMRQRGLLR